MILHCVIRSNLSLSPEESWLPIVSILLCIIHIQVLQEVSSLYDLFTRGFKNAGQDILCNNIFECSYTLILKYCGISFV